MIEKLINDEPNARFIFQNYPLSGHNWAFKGASYADCVAQENNAAFWKFIKSVFDEQQNITESNADEKLTALANAAGVDGKATAACAAQPQTRARVEQSLALGNAVDVTGTPSLFINGRKITNVDMPYETLKALVDYQAKRGK